MTMSKQAEIERFTKEVMNNEAFREQLKSLGSDQEAVIKVANAQGYDFSMADLSALAPAGELSDSQLENVAGGMILLSGDSTVLSGTTKGYVYFTKGKTLIW
jgi:predicted ribosomally synthesized peptide with nif11-like leader